MDVPGVVVEPSPRSDVEATSGLGDREQDTPEWIQPFTEGLVEEKSGSSGRACASQCPKYFSTFSSETLEETWRRTQFICSFSEVIHASAQISRELHGETWTSRTQDAARHHRDAVVVQELATQWITEFHRWQTRQHQIRSEVCSDSSFKKGSLEWFTLKMLWRSRKLAKTWFGITTRRLHTNPKQTESPKELSEWAKEWT